MFGIADEILVMKYDSSCRDHDNTLQRVLQKCRKENLKLNKDKCPVWFTSVPFFGEIISRQGMRPDMRKLKALTDLPPPKSKKELQVFLGILNYLRKFSPITAEVYKPLR